MTQEDVIALRKDWPRLTMDEKRERLRAFVADKYALDVLAIQLGLAPSYLDRVIDGHFVQRGKRKMRRDIWTAICVDCGNAASRGSERCKSCATKMRTVWTKESIITMMQEWYRLYGSPPSRRDWDQDPEWPSSSAAAKRFGAWGKALEAAGFDAPTSYPRTPEFRENESRKRRKWTEEKILESLHAWVAVHGRPPRASDWNRVGENHPENGVVYKVFGSWDRMLLIAGLETRSGVKVRQR